MFLRLLRLLALMNAIRREDPALWGRIREFCERSHALE